MKVTIEILEGPLAQTGREPEGSAAEGAGALLMFEGIVRRIEGEGTIEALQYQTYEPMAQTMLERIAREVGERHGLLAVHVRHSRGRVGVGEVSFRLRIEAAHRKAALAAMDEFIDRMKQDVPIWKQPVWEQAPPGS